MKLGYFITHLPYGDGHSTFGVGGAEFTALLLARDMVEQGHEVTICATSEDTKDHVEKHGDLVLRWYGTQFGIRSSRFSAGLFYAPLKQDFDVVHAHATVPSALVAAYTYSKIRRVPLIVTFHSELDSRLFTNPVYKTGTLVYNSISKKIANHARCVICPSRYFSDASVVLQDYQHKVEIIPNRVDLKEFRSMPPARDGRGKLGGA